MVTATLAVLSPVNRECNSYIKCVMTPDGYPAVNLMRGTDLKKQSCILMLGSWFVDEAIISAYETGSAGS